MPNHATPTSLRCPACGETSAAIMPTTACMYFWDCPACHVVVRPKPGDCCVFCSYGSEPCAPKASQ